MGLFSSIGNILGKVSGVAGAVTGQPWFGAAASGLGALWSNKQAKDAASRQMSFQAGMSNTAYQRAVTDMRSAGLNPILAYSQGGASSPSGATYNPVNVGTAAHGGSARSLEMQNMKAQNQNIGASTALSMQQARKLDLENEAWATLSPAMRAFVMSGSGLGGTAIAGGQAFKGLAGLLSKLRKPPPVQASRPAFSPQGKRIYYPDQKYPWQK